MPRGKSTGDTVRAQEGVEIKYKTPQDTEPWQHFPWARCPDFPSLSLSMRTSKHVGIFSIDPLPSHTTFSVLLDTKLINKQWFTDVLWKRCSHLILLPCHPHLALLRHLLAPNFHRHPLYSTHPLAFISQPFSPPFPSTSSSLPLPLPPPLPLSLHQKAEDINTFQPGEG